MLASWPAQGHKFEMVGIFPAIFICTGRNHGEALGLSGYQKWSAEMIDKQNEVAFLADNFDLPAARAAKLVADSQEEAERLAAQQLADEASRDPYQDAPVPTSPEEREVPENGGLQKTVLRTDNERGRAGP
jgi:hypothetical protein